MTLIIIISKWMIYPTHPQEKVQDSYAKAGRGVTIQLLESVYRFSLGAVAGGQ